jgi:uncharacterized protein (DUF362 family)
MQMSLVSIVKVEESQNIYKAIDKALDLIRFRFPNKIRRVIIKPNLCYYWDYSTGQTTDPKFIELLIELLREKISPNINISIVESDASAMRCKYAFKVLGYEEIAEKHKVNLINLTNEESDNETTIVNSKKLIFKVPRIIKDADLRINVPKPKYWPNVKLTCALKNIFGCNPNPKKYQYHKNINETIVALNKLMKFDLCLLDGMVVTGGSHPKKIGLIMASTDPVAFDAAVAKIMGIRPKSIRYLVLAQKEGLGRLNFSPIGDNLNHIMDEFPKKKFRNKMFEFAYKLVYKFRLEKRIGIE